jgi:hypothetical protein
MVNIKTYFPGITDIIAKYGIAVDLIDGWYKYRIGKFPTKEQAESVRNDLRNLGYIDCFLIELK